MSVAGSSVVGHAAATEESPLPRPPGVLRRYWARHPWVTDSLVTLLYLVFIALGATISAIPDPFFVEDNPFIIAMWRAALVVSVVAVFLRRRLPLTALGLSAVSSALLFSLAGDANVAALLFCLYAVPVYRSVRAAWISCAIGVASGFAGGWISLAVRVSETTAAGTGPLDDNQYVVHSLAGAQFAVLMVVATLIGINVGNRKRYLGALVGHAAQLVRERDQQAEIARSAERARIAREMHDVVAHSLSVVVALADGAAAMSARDPARSRAAMETVAETARTSLAEMRLLLGVLTDDGDHAPLEPQPGLAQLSTLVDTYAATGLPVELRVTGDLPGNPALELNVYRIAQESLTNALRHADSPTRVLVTVAFTHDADGRLATVQVTDDGRRRSPDGRSDGGRGILGISQRAEMFGGEASASSGADGGWTVTATLHERHTA